MSREMVQDLLAALYREAYDEGVQDALEEGGTPHKDTRAEGAYNFVERHTDAIAAMPPAGRVEQWQPIESAPKDGSWVLLWDGSAYYLCQWDVEEAEWIDGARFHSGNAATHWRPLPDPPGGDK